MGCGYGRDCATFIQLEHSSGEAMRWLPERLRWRGSKPSDTMLISFRTV